MPVITTLISSPASGIGISADSVASNLPVTIAEPTEAYGLPALIHGPASTPSPIPNAVRGTVYDANGTFVRHLPNPQGLRWLDEFNTAGAGSIDLLRYDSDVTETTVGPNLATNPNGEDGDTDWSPPATLTEDTAPAGAPETTALHAQVNTGFARDFHHDPIPVGAAPQTVRISWWGYVTGAGDTLTLSVARSNSDFSASEGIGTPVVIVPSDGWVQYEEEVETSTDFPYIVAQGHLEAVASNANSWVTALSVQVLTTTTTTTPVGDLNAGDQVLVSVGALNVFRIILDAEPGYRIDPATGLRTNSWAGLGQLGVLNSGMVEPEYGWRPEATDQRTFDYGSNPAIGGWYVPAEWKQPVGKRVRKSWRWTYKKRHLPKGWPDRKAQWLWWKNPDTTSVPDEICYLVSSYTLANPSRVKFWASGDDTLELQVDGEVRITAGPGSWKKPSTVVLTQAAGVHYVAAKVSNSPATDGASNRSGFICSVARVAGDGDVIAWIRRTTPATWKIRRQLSGPPGWFPAQILRRLVDEAKARTCAGHGQVTYGFTTKTDSAGLAWTSRKDIALTIGTLGLDWIQQLIEAGIDVSMTPDLRLNAWRRRGSDRSKTVRIDQSGAHPTDESGSQLPGKRNVLYGRSRTGWVGVSDADSIAATGRREAMATLGSARSSTQTQATLNSMLPDMAAPPLTIEARLSGASTGPQPYSHFFVGDWISYKASGETTWSRYRVMSIAGEVTDTGHPDWTLQLYSDPLG